MKMKFWGFVGFWVGMLILTLGDGLIAWLLLDGVFDLGFWVWVAISFVGIQIVRSGAIAQEILAKSRSKGRRGV